MQKGDLFVMPSKQQPVVYIGEITGDYQFEPKGPSPYFHWRSVKWVGEAIPRSHFGQDLLYSFGAFMTICRIQRNNAEERIRTMMTSGWKPESLASAIKSPSITADVSAAEELPNLEELAQDQIARVIEARFKGHNFTRLIEAILKAQGYTTWLSPEGADGGADILAGTGPLGFGSPSLCVEVKSESSAIDRPTVDKLLGAVTKFGAQQGLFVAWGGFKSGVHKDLATSYFRVRLWSRNDIIDQLFTHYDKLDESIRAELPLKRIWMVALTGDEP
jgi:restriction system protein